MSLFVAGGIFCILSNIVTQSIIIRCNRKNRQCQLNYGQYSLPLRIFLLYLLKGLLESFVGKDFYYIIRIYTLKGKLKQNKLVKVLIKLVHIHSSTFHKSLFESGENVLGASHVIIDCSNQVCVCVCRQ